jgi:diadenosine tetraphosphate (Ap4A) HIT family hydrolase
MNYAWLGNLFHEHGGHGHMHVIPRYAVVREFLGAEFKDERYGDNYVPYQKRPLFGIQIREMIELLRTMMPK